MYAANRDSLARHLETVQFDAAQAHAIADFSVRQVGWFVLFFVLGGGLMALMFSGVLAGRRAVWGAGLLGLLLAVDLGRANLPWVIYWNYHEKYLSNPVVDLLRNQPWEHRVDLFQTAMRRSRQNVAGPALQDRLAAGPVSLLQHPDRGDRSQMPRMPADIVAFMHALLPPNRRCLPWRLAVRFWQIDQ